MTDPVYAHDLTAYRRAVGEMLRLARALPDGLDRLRAFAAGGEFADWSERVEDGAVVLVAAPSARLVGFLDDLRAAQKGRAA